MIQQPELYEIVDHEMAYVMPRGSIQSNLAPMSYITPVDLPTWIQGSSSQLQPIAYQTFAIEDEPQLAMAPASTAALLPLRSSSIQYEALPMAVSPRRLSTAAPIAIQSTPIVRLNQTPPTAVATAAALPPIRATRVMAPNPTAARFVAPRASIIASEPTLRRIAPQPSVVRFPTVVRRV